MTDPEKIIVSGQGKAIPITQVTKLSWLEIRKGLPAVARNWAKANDFEGDAHRFLAVPDDKGGLLRVIAGLDSSSVADPFGLGRLARILPPGLYSFDASVANPRLAALGIQPRRPVRRDQVQLLSADRDLRLQNSLSLTQ